MKKILSVVLAIVIVLGGIPLNCFTGIKMPDWFDMGLKVEAANTVSVKMQEVLSLFPDGSNFTVNGNSCPAGHGSACSNCYYPNVVRNRLGWQWSNMYSSWSCYGFTCFVTRYIFGTEWPRNSYVVGSANLSNTTACDNLLNQAKIGDIISIGTAHRAIFLQKTDGGMIVYDSNQGDKNGLCNKVRYGKTNTYSGLIKYYGYVNIELRRMNNYNDFVQDTTPPTSLVVKIDKYAVNIDESFTVACSANNANRYWIGFYLDNVLIKDTTTYSGAATVSLTKQGMYSVAVAAINSLGEIYAYSNVVVGDASMYIPETPNVTLSDSVVEVGEQLEVSFSANKAEEYWVGFYKNGTLIKDILTTSNKYVISFDEPDNYSVTVTAKNKYGSSYKNIWFVVGKYKVFYNANGGSGAPASQTKDYGVDLILSSTVPTRSNHIFLGWSTSSTAISATYHPGDSFSSNENITLYAVWKEIENDNNYKFEPVNDLTIIDNDTKTIYGLEEGVYDLEGYVEYSGCELEYNMTANGFGTGATVDIVKDGEVIDTYTIVIFGDINGDGYVDSFDVPDVMAFVNYGSQYESGSAQEMAADINGDGFVDESDLFLIDLASTFAYTIEQSR